MRIVKADLATKTIPSYEIPAQTIAITECHIKQMGNKIIIQGGPFNREFILDNADIEEKIYDIFCYILNQEIAAQDRTGALLQVPVIEGNTVEDTVRAALAAPKKETKVPEGT